MRQLSNSSPSADFSSENFHQKKGRMKELHYK